MRIEHTTYVRRCNTDVSPSLLKPCLYACTPLALSNAAGCGTSGRTHDWKVGGRAVLRFDHVAHLDGG